MNINRRYQVQLTHDVSDLSEIEKLGLTILFSCHGQEKKKIIVSGLPQNASGLNKISYVDYWEAEGNDKDPYEGLKAFSRA